jgi:hypothetical protein
LPVREAHDQRFGENERQKDKPEDGRKEIHDILPASKNRSSTLYAHKHDKVPTHIFAQNGLGVAARVPHIVLAAHRALSASI